MNITKTSWRGVVSDNTYVITSFLLLIFAGLSIAVFFQYYPENYSDAPAFNNWVGVFVITATTGLLCLVVSSLIMVIRSSIKYIILAAGFIMMYFFVAQYNTTTGHWLSAVVALLFYPLGAIRSFLTDITARAKRYDAKKIGHLTQIPFRNKSGELVEGKLFLPQDVPLDRITEEMEKEGYSPANEEALVHWAEVHALFLGHIIPIAPAFGSVNIGSVRAPVTCVLGASMGSSEEVQTGYYYRSNERIRYLGLKPIVS